MTPRQRLLLATVIRHKKTIGVGAAGAATVGGLAYGDHQWKKRIERMPPAQAERHTKLRKGVGEAVGGLATVGAAVGMYKGGAFKHYRAGTMLGAGGSRLARAAMNIGKVLRRV